MQSELKPCPFCGGDAEYHSDKGPTGEVYAWVGCNQCDAMSVHCDVRSMQPEETHPIDAWNARASDAEITRLTEALRAADEREKALREAEVKAARLLERLRDFDGWTGTFHAGHAYDARQEAISYLNSRQALAGAKP